MKQIKELIRKIKLDVCIKHQDPALGLVWNNFKEFENIILSSGKECNEIKKDWKQITQSIEYTLQKIDVPVFIDLKFQDERIDKEMYERITRKLFAVVRYQLYHKIKQYYSE